jgi:cell division protein ZipA
MQPSALEDAQTIFDDFIDTINLLAIELDGYALDHLKQPFSDETLQALRNSL